VLAGVKGSDSLAIGSLPPTGFIQTVMLALEEQVVERTVFFPVFTRRPFDKGRTLRGRTSRRITVAVDIFVPKLKGSKVAVRAEVGAQTGAMRDAATALLRRTSWRITAALGIFVPKLKGSKMEVRTEVGAQTGATRDAATAHSRRTSQRITAGASLCPN
jgi:hypothetical protein